MMKLFLRWFAAAMFLVASNVLAYANLSCAPHGGYNAADFSQSLLTLTGPNKSNGFKAIKSIGIKTVMRYYDFGDSVLFCKSLTPPETEAILKHGLSIITVFQDGGRDPEDFINQNLGAIHTKRAIQMAKANGQPAGSAIYFAVDGVDQRIKDMAFEHSISDGRNVSAKRKKKLSRADRTVGLHFKYYNRYLKYHRSIFRKKGSEVVALDMMPFVERYFAAIQKQMNELPANERYKIGVYSSGQICQHIRKKGLVEYCWLAMSRKWPGTQQVLKNGSWHIDQAAPTRCSSWRYRKFEKVSLDFNRVKGNAGQWSRQVNPSGVLSARSICSNPELQSYFNPSATPAATTVALKDEQLKITPAKSVEKIKEVVVVKPASLKEGTSAKKATVKKTASKSKSKRKLSASKLRHSKKKS